MSEYNQLPDIAQTRAIVAIHRQSPRQREEDEQLGIGGMTEDPEQASHGRDQSSACDMP